MKELTLKFIMHGDIYFTVILRKNSVQCVHLFINVEFHKASFLQQNIFCFQKNFKMQINLMIQWCCRCATAEGQW